MEHPSGLASLQIKTPNLWEKAFNQLSDDDRALLKLDKNQKHLEPSQVVDMVEEKKKECDKSQWVICTNDKGEKVKVRDKLTQVSEWIEQFIQVGDVAVQFDPGHAALPWAGMSVNEVQTFGSMIESVEVVSSIITRYKEAEDRVFVRTSVLTEQLYTAIVKLYRSALAFLARANKYYSQNTIKRLARGVIHSSKSVVETPMLSIEKQEEDVMKLVTLVQHEVQGIKLDDIIDRLKKSVEDSRTSKQEQRQRLEAWINGVTTENAYETSIHNRHAETCEWAVKLSQFQSWAFDNPPQARLLWVHGPAGFGKTVMSSWMVRHLKQRNIAPLSYFFCRADDEFTRDPYSTLRSWLAQLLGQDDDVDSPRMWELFVAAGKALPGCTFVIDGFDECTTIDAGVRYHHNDDRSDFLKEMLDNLQYTNSRVMVVSRDVADIRQWLGQEHGSYGIMKSEYSITANDTNDDVLSFSKFVVDKRVSKKKGETVRDSLASQAAMRSEGMFLWIQLLEKEMQPSKSLKELKKIVRDMPQDISGAYTKELQRIVGLSPSEKDRAVMILRWMLFATRPLRVKQLAGALIVSGDEDLDEYPEDDLPDDWFDGFVDEDYVRDRILAPCGSLLKVRSSSSETPLADRTVQFVHFSVKEYLLELTTTEPKNEWATRLGLSDAAVEHRNLSNICLRYLTLNIFRDMPQDTEIYPCLSYAAWAWYFHGFHGKPAPPKDFLEQTQRVFNPADSCWKVWSPHMEAKLKESEMVEPSRNIPGEMFLNWGEEAEILSGYASGEVQTPMYYASLLGLIDVVKWLEDQGLDFGVIGGRFGFPLQAAVVRNHEELVKYLLNRRVEVSQKGGQFGSSIIAAAAMATPGIVEILLAAGADVEAVDEAVWTALHHAAKRGSDEIVRLLLNKGADANATTTDRWTAVGLCCQFGHKNALSILIESRADLDPKGEGVMHPLEAAINGDNAEIVEILLSKNVSADLIMGDGMSAINHAIWSPDLVQRLLDQGANPNKPDNKGWMPLEYAASEEAVGSMEILIAHHTQVINDHDLDFEMDSPLDAAIVNGQLAADVLLKHNVDLDRKGRAGVTALLLAVETEQLDAVEWLLDAGASMQCIFESNQASTFDRALECQDHAIARLLVQRGFFQIQNHKDDNPLKANGLRDNDGLVMRTYGNDLEGVKQILAGNGGSRDSAIINEALLVASAKGFLSIAQTLLERGARLGLKDINGRIALHHAAINLKLDVADLLLGRGASVLVEDLAGSTPIDLAVTHGEKAFEFIQNHMDDLALTINRRPSLLSASSNQPGRLSATEIRKFLSGSWSGQYESISFNKGRKDDFSMAVSEHSVEGLHGNTFSNSGCDVAGHFQFHGFVDPIGTVWFVKLYARHGWLYRGSIIAEKGCFTGTWGSNRKLWHGTFKVFKENF
ncbi:ankyrin repeat-containing domain protein [Fusarium tricinctum]|uniref:Ankyrin repeat-containing domain protein n=1 Tax=Fusarium tricinctum TaxID=61284 RepID=A0A8K0RSX6_9HYPO|nr:ankyrin repeat-containing domain protein [Fusarium tricinctum]